MAYDLSPEQIKAYKPSHTEDCKDSDCQMLSVESSKLESILQDGGLPIVRLDDEASHPKLTLERWEGPDHSGYIALSHVWFDGLGNQNSNSLPLCQARRITSLVSQCQTARNVAYLWNSRFPRPLEEPVIWKSADATFWLDTLCVPRGSEFQVDVDDLKRKAISNIPAVFRSARGVLILDKDLDSMHDLFQQSSASTEYLDQESRSGRNIQNLIVRVIDSFQGISGPKKQPGQLTTSEVNYRIVATKWMQRAWTYEEAVVAPALFAQIHGPEAEVIYPNDNRNQGSTWYPTKALDPLRAKSNIGTRAMRRLGKVDGFTSEYSTGSSRMSSSDRFVEV